MQPQDCLPLLALYEIVDKTLARFLLSVTVAPPPMWQPPSSEEFLADINGRQSQLVPHVYIETMSVIKSLAETGQEEDLVKLVEVRSICDTLAKFLEQDNNGQGRMQEPSLHTTCNWPAS